PAVSAAKTAEEPHGPQVGFLDGVLRILIAPGEPARQVVGRPHVGQEGTLESLQLGRIQGLLRPGLLFRSGFRLRFRGGPAAWRESARVLDPRAVPRPWMRANDPEPHHILPHARTPPS